jgi:hypothetical protein
MRIVAAPGVREHIEERGGSVYVWAKASGCCHGRSYTLESATEPPDREFELVHAADGFCVFASRGLLEPESLELELSRRGKLRAYWNGQAWIG